MGAENVLKLVEEKDASSAEAQAKDEIDEIMNEIESLKESMTESPKGKVATANTSQAPPEIEESAVQTETETEAETEAETDIETETEIEAITQMVEPEEIEMPSKIQKSSDEDGCLTMTLSGKMTLRLQYEYADQGIIIGFVDNMLHVELSDGTEFKIPIHQSTSYRKAA